MSVCYYVPPPPHPPPPLIYSHPFLLFRCYSVSFVFLNLKIPFFAAGATIYILGSKTYQTEAGLGSWYDDSKICANLNNFDQCAYIVQGGFLANVFGTPASQVSLSYSGIPKNCDSVTGKCATSAGSTAICSNFRYSPLNVNVTIKIECANTSLSVNGSVVNVIAPTIAALNIGVYFLKYKSTDASDTCYYVPDSGIPLSTTIADPSCSRIVNITDITKPTITLAGPSVVFLEGGSTFEEPAGTFAFDC